MRFAGGILLGLALATAAAVVAPIGCGVDSNRYPGLGNDLPNMPNTDGDITTQTSSGTGTSGGTAAGVCDCAATILAPDGGACATCAGKQVLAGGPCEQLQASCNNDPAMACQSAIVCAATCATSSNPGGCMEGCALQSPLFQQLMTCECAGMACKKSCSVTSPIACNLGTGGAGGSGTTTSSATGGAGGGP